MISQQLHFQTPAKWESELGRGFRSTTEVLPTFGSDLWEETAMQICLAKAEGSQCAAWACYERKHPPPRQEVEAGSFLQTSALEVAWGHFFFVLFVSREPGFKGQWAGTQTPPFHGKNMQEFGGCISRLPHQLECHFLREVLQAIFS